MAKLWGSRFDKKSDKLADQFSFSIAYDKRLAKYDCLGGIAHAQMLAKCKIIPYKDASKICQGLNKILQSLEKGTFKFDLSQEDVHSNIQTALKKLIGPAADKLHTARSRNDLIVLDMKMYLREESQAIIDGIVDFQKSILKFADKNQDILIPAYTHLQAAQIVTLSHHMLAYIEMLERDKSRLYGSLKRNDAMPLGSCALSGTTLPIDRKYVAKLLGFNKATSNSIDSVSDRDFIIEALSHLAILGTHFSRIAEDLIIWCTSEFNFIDIDSAFCTGSSIMPHKKNPDMLELIRGESATLISNLNQVLVLTKGLPLTYNRDLQLDKPPLFESIEKIQLMLGILTKLFDTLKIKKEVLEKRIKDELFYSVDIMEALIKKGFSYREAHDTVGKMVKDSLTTGKSIGELAEKHLDSDVKNILNAKASVKAKISLGSTNPKLVAQEIKQWKKVLKNA